MAPPSSDDDDGDSTRISTPNYTGGGSDDDGGGGGGGGVDVGGGPDPGDVNVDVGGSDDGGGGGGGGVNRGPGVAGPSDEAQQGGGGSDGGDGGDTGDTGGGGNGGDGGDGGGADRSQPPGAGPATIEDPESVQGVETVSGAGGDVGRATRARRVEQRVLEENPGLTSEDVRIESAEGGGFRAELTRTGRRSIAADQLNVDPSDVRVSPSGQVTAGSAEGEDALELSAAEREVREEFPGAESISIVGVEESAYRARVETADGETFTRRFAFSDEAAEAFEGGGAPEDPGPTETTADAPIEDDVTGERSPGTRRLFPEGTETETVGAAGPMGVTVPVDRQPPIDVGRLGRDVIDVVARDPGGPPGAGVGVRQSRGTIEDWEQLQRGIEESLTAGETVDVSPPADARRVVGAAGPLGVTAPRDRLDVDDVARAARQGGEAAERFAAGLDDPVDGPTGPREVPEGAPGVGVGDRESRGTIEDWEQLQRGIEESLTAEGTGVGDYPRGPRVGRAGRRVVGAAGPLGVTAPRDRLDAEDVSRAASETAEAAESFGRGLTEPVEGPTGPREVPEGAPGVGVGVSQGPQRYPSIEGFVEQTTEAVGEASAPLSADLERRAVRRGAEPIGEGIARDIETTVVTTEEAEDLPERREQFGDWDPVVGGVAVEPTLRAGSRGFRDVTGAAARRGTEAAGLRQGSFADVTAETAITTFPEIFNAPGLAAETLEIGEAAGYAAQDPDERVPELAREGGRRVRAGVDYVLENPAVGLGAGAAIALQLPTSLATLRGIGAVSQTAMRVQDLTWNFPERTAKRVAGIQDRPIGFELQRTRRRVVEALGRAPGAETRTAAFGGGSGPGQVVELRAAGRTVATAEAEAETRGEVDPTGGARRRIEEAEGRFSPDPGEAEIETGPEYRLGPTPEAETAIRIEAEAGRQERAQQPSFRRFPTAQPSREVAQPLAIGETDLGIEADSEIEQEIEQEVETEVEQEIEQEIETELEQEIEQEQEAEPEAEIEWEPEREPEAARPALPEFDRRKRRRRGEELDVSAQVYEAPIATAREVSGGLAPDDLDAIESDGFDLGPSDEVDRGQQQLNGADRGSAARQRVDLPGGPPQPSQGSRAGRERPRRARDGPDPSLPASSPPGGRSDAGGGQQPSAGGLDALDLDRAARSAEGMGSIGEAKYDGDIGSLDQGAID